MMTETNRDSRPSLAVFCYDAIDGWCDEPPAADFPRSWERNLIASGFQEAIDRAGGPFALRESRRLRVHYEIEQPDPRLAEDFRRELVLAIGELLATDKSQVERSVFRRFFLTVSTDCDETTNDAVSSTEGRASSQTTSGQAYLDTQSNASPNPLSNSVFDWLTFSPEAFQGVPQAIEALRSLRSARRDLAKAILPRFQLVLDSLSGQTFESRQESLELLRIINKERASLNIQLRVKGREQVPIYLNASKSPRAKRVSFLALSADRQRRSIWAKNSFPPLEASLSGDETADSSSL